MAVVTTQDDFTAYADDDGNRLDAVGARVQDLRVNFKGRNNRVVLANGAALGTLRVDFDCDNGVLEIGSSRGVPRFSAAIRIGQDAEVRIGRDVSSTSTVAMSAVEGAHIAVGDDVMFASENQVRTDDGHPIFDVRTGRRVNVSTDITIGSHVWLGRFSTLLGGAAVGTGSVVGYGAVLTKAIPNNCVAVGVPARVVRRDIAWERPHLSLSRPYYKPDATAITKSEYWQLTADRVDGSEGVATRRPGSVRRRVRATALGRSLAPAIRAVRRARASRAS